MAFSSKASVLNSDFARRLAHIAERGATLAMPGLRTAGFMALSWRDLAGLGGPGDGMPLVKPNLSMAVKVAIDETVRAMLVPNLPLPSAAELHRVRGEFQQAAALYESRGWSANPALYHRQPPPITSPQIFRRRVLGLDVEHLQFDSDYQPRSGEPGADRWLARSANRKGHAWLLRHHDRPRPWLMCIHGYRMGQASAGLAAFHARYLHEELGLNLVMPVLPLHGPRAGRHRSGEGFMVADSMDTLFAVSQGIWDLRRLLSWIRGPGEAVSTGAYGISLGGYHASLLSSLDGALDCVIAGIPATSFSALAREHLPSSVRTWLERAGVNWTMIDNLQRVISPMSLPCRTPHRGRHIFAGVADRLVSRGQVNELWHHWERPNLHWYQGTHLSFNLDQGVQDFIDHALDSTGMSRAAAARSSEHASRAA
ncbi:MAG: hypothetical protein HRT46_04795 [Deltaproteobacteria bacterium]|nr:hypothetical protein [Deltaproteobacteria bacterium]